MEILSDIIKLTTAIIPLVVLLFAGKKKSAAADATAAAATATVSQNQRRSFHSWLSLLMLFMAFANLMYVTFGPPRFVPLTGETGAMLAFGLVFLLLSFRFQDMD